MTHYCVVCGLVLTPTVEVRENRYYISYRCADHPRAAQNGAETPREVDGD